MKKRLYVAMRIKCVNVCQDIYRASVKNYVVSGLGKTFDRMIELRYKVINSGYIRELTT